jgi:hypothetical protein
VGDAIEEGSQHSSEKGNKTQRPSLRGYEKRTAFCDGIGSTLFRQASYNIHDV